MNTAQGSIGVKAPIGSVYRRWLRFEDFPKFMTAVKEVERLDANHFFMAAVCNGKRIEGVLEIMLRGPERRLAWRLVGGKS
ncbi:MAG TPA: SRPBCC family protein, partial [Candidatus Udaeobacter sp.]|nr:SRPBCC family protein [Candidatus Udaeobacter sp.]